MNGTSQRKPADRRGFLTQAGRIAALALGWRLEGAADEDSDPAAKVGEPSIREYLQGILPARDDVDAWLAGKAFPFSKYDPQLGYLHVDRDFREGQDGAVCSYRYDRAGARRMIMHADRPCRINSYGNSFTSCEQVSDGETWQEKLASHLGEPVRNFGIGGYSVYQAWLRLQREERRVPVRYVIFNIFDDDHARNLLGWQRFKFGVNSKSINPTVPHVLVDLEAGRLTERPNPCENAERLYELCDIDKAFGLFRDDFYLHNQLARAALRAAGDDVPATDYDDQRLMRHGIFATLQIIQRVEQFARQAGKQVLYVLSYGAYTIKQYLDAGTRFDQALVDYLKTAGLPFVDLMQAHANEARRFKGTADEALARYFIGHYNPLGNHFCAFAMKDALVSMLDPKPPAYAP
jgi:hypothetical protein